MGRPKGPASDSQRTAVYKWERGFYAVKHNAADPQWFKATLHSFCRKYGVKPPKVLPMPRKWRKLYAGVSSHKDGYVAFCPGWTSTMVLCHETAHWVMDAYGYGDIGAHGPKWLGVYLWMLSRANVLPLDLAVYSARKAGLKFRDPVKECAPGRLKKYLKKR